jgi:hephaestin
MKAHGAYTTARRGDARWRAACRADDHRAPRRCTRWRTHDVDRELVAGLPKSSENISWYVEDNIKAYAGDPKGVKLGTGTSGEIVPSAEAGTYFRETINGLSFGNTPGFTMKAGSRVRWYLMASTNFEFHAPHWHGNVVTANQMRTDVGMLVPMGMLVADMVPDNPGRWFFHCHVGDHLRMGMQALYTVDK